MEVADTAAPVTAQNQGQEPASPDEDNEESKYVLPEGIVNEPLPRGRTDIEVADYLAGVAANVECLEKRDFVVFGPIPSVDGRTMEIIGTWLGPNGGPEDDVERWTQYNQCHNQYLEPVMEFSYGTNMKGFELLADQRAPVLACLDAAVDKHNANNRLSRPNEAVLERPSESDSASQIAATSLIDLAQPNGRGNGYDLKPIQACRLDLSDLDTVR